MRLSLLTLPFALGGTLLALTAPAVAASSTEIAMPHRGEVITASSTRVVVKVSPAARRLQAALNGVDVADSFHRRNGGVWVATLRRPTLRGGANRLTVKTSRSSQRAVSFTVGTRRGGFTGIRVGSGSSGSVPVTISTVGDQDLRLIARLNGQSVTRSFVPRWGKRRTARLGVDDGLRHGRNVLEVVTVRSDGRYAIARRTFSIAPSRILVGAGRNARMAAGTSLRLTAKVRRQGRPLAANVRWSVVKRPRGSKSTPRGAVGTKTSFRPDRPGRYVLRATAASLGSTALDEVTLTAVAGVPPLGIPVTSISWNGSVVVGDQSYAYDPNEDAVMAVIVDRNSGAVLESDAFSGSAADATTLLKILATYHSLGDEPLLILGNLSFGPSTEVDSAWNNVIQGVGGTSIRSISNGQSGWSIIGVYGASQGAAWLNQGWNDNSSNPTPGQMQGYLQRDSNDLYSFVPAERLQLDLAASGAPAGQNTMIVGTTAYPSGALSDGTQTCTSGIQVLAFASENLGSFGGQSFGTNGCGASGGSSSSGLQAAVAYLNAAAQGYPRGPALVLVQTIGTPWPASADRGLWAQFQAAAVALGGTAEAVGDGTGSYSLVGSSGGVAEMPRAEGSSTLTGAPAHVTAVLKRARGGDIVPHLVSSSGPFTGDLAVLAYGPSQAANPTAGQLAALAYIANNVLHLDAPEPETACTYPAVDLVRTQYCNSKYFGSWSGDWENDVLNAPYPSGVSFSQTDWQTVTQQLGGTDGEFAAVDELRTTITTMQGANLSNDVQAVTIAAAQAATIEKALQPQQSTLGSWLDFAGDLGEVVALAGGVVSEEFEKPLGFLAAGLLVAGDTTNEIDGASSLGNFDVAAADFAAELSSNYGVANTELDHLGDIIATDRGKLLAFAAGSQYAINQSAELNSAMALASAQFAWGALLPAAYELVRLPRSGINTGVTNAQDYQCSYMDGSDAGSYYPFPSAPNTGQLSTPHLYALVKAGARLPNGSNRATPTTPPATLTDPLFQPYAESNGLITAYAMVKPWFFRDSYSLSNAKSVQC